LASSPPNNLPPRPTTMLARLTKSLTQRSRPPLLTKQTPTTKTSPSFLYSLLFLRRYSDKPHHKGKDHEEPVIAQTGPKKLLFSLTTPLTTIMHNEVIEIVTIPGEGGVQGILANHSPIITELKPGVLKIKKDGKNLNYFVSGGFAFVHKDSTCSVSAVECVPLEQLDGDEAKKSLQTYQDLMNKAGDEESKAIAKVAFQTAQAICMALGVK